MTHSLKLTLAAVALSAALTPLNSQATLFADRGLWESTVGTWADVDETQIPSGFTALSGNSLSLPSGASLSLGSIAYGVNAAEWGRDWSSDAPLNQPAGILFSFGTISATLSQPLSSFGLELAPVQPASFQLTLLLSNSTPPVTITQTSNGGYAQFLGWADMPVTGFVLSSTDPLGFGFARLVEGAGAPPPPPTNGVPDGGNLVFATGALWIGLMGANALRRKRVVVLA